VHDLITLGKLSVMPPTTQQIVKQMQENPRFILPTHFIHMETDADWEIYQKAYSQDPYDVQLLFLMHNKLWSGKNSDPAAFQYIRRAIELSPGHGKAHMAVICSGAEDADLLFHAELGYRLLPGNSFAVGNYLIYLQNKKIPPPDISIVYEVTALDPCNITPYWLGIELLKLAGHFEEALGLAMQLKKVVTPPLDERTIYCISQNPEQAAKWKAGTYDPLKVVEKEISRLRSQISAGAKPQKEF